MPHKAFIVPYSVLLLTLSKFFVWLDEVSQSILIIVQLNYWSKESPQSFYIPRCLG